MLAMKPTCEHCNQSLPPSSTEARICSFECTFCVDCAENLLQNVCPNCGGGFCERPVRPVENWKNGYFLGRFPASDKITHKPVDLHEHVSLVARLRDRPQETR